LGSAYTGRGDFGGNFFFLFFFSFWKFFLHPSARRKAFLAALRAVVGAALQAATSQLCSLARIRPASALLQHLVHWNEALELEVARWKLPV
jgi:hypothetical protein